MVEELLLDKKIIDIIEHPNNNYKNQRIFILKIEGYFCKVPFVENENEIFLKTIFPDRRLKKIYI